MTIVITEHQISQTDFLGIDFVFAVAQGERQRGINLRRTEHHRQVELFLREGNDLILVEVDDIKNVSRICELRTVLRALQNYNGMSSSMSARFAPP